MNFEVYPEDAPIEYHSFGECNSRYKWVGCFRDAARSGRSAPVKEAMTMRHRHLLRRPGCDLSASPRTRIVESWVNIDERGLQEQLGAGSG